MPAEHHTNAIGAPANPDKTNTIDQAGSPNSEEEEVRRFLQDRSINDKFTFNHGERKSYKDITIHLRETLTKEERLKRAQKRETSYQELYYTRSSKTNPQPPNSKGTTHLKADTKPKGNRRLSLPGLPGQKLFH